MNRIKTGIKLQVTPEESKQVQEICFANDIVWEIKQKECRHTDKKFLYIDDYLTWGCIDRSFEANSNEEVDASLFIRTKGSCGEENQELEETPEQPTEAKPKQYLCYVSGKALPKRVHETLEQAMQEAQRLCRKELAEVMVLEVVSKYQAKVIVEEV